MDITDTFDFTAPPEVVFDSLTDPDRANRWLPVGARMRQLDEQRVLVFHDSTSAEYEVSTAAAELRLSWRCLDPPDLHGSARVEDGAVGGSRVHVAVSTPENGPDPAMVRDLVGQAMHNLHRDVTDNFNAG